MKINDKLKKEEKKIDEFIFKENTDGYPIERKADEWAIIEGIREYFEKIEKILKDFETFYENKLNKVEQIDWNVMLDLMEFKQIFELFYEELTGDKLFSEDIIENKLFSDDIIENKRLEIIQAKFNKYREEFKEDEEKLGEENIAEKLDKIARKLDIELLHVKK